MKRRTQKKKVIGPLYMMLIYSAAVLFLEIVFQAATTRTTFTGFAYKVLFSLVYGTIGYILCSLFKNRKVNNIITHVWLGFTTVIYIVQYLLYKQFKQFYDLNTMGGGAGDALTSYFGELMHLIFIQGGLFIMLLMFLPFVANLLWGKKVFAFNAINWRNRAIAAITGALVHILAIMLVLMHPTNSLIYYKEYNFHAAVSTFGYVTGLRLDLQQMLFPPAPSFDNVAMPTVSAEADATNVVSSIQKDPEIEYGYNQIDLDTLMNKSGNSAIKKLNEYVKTLEPTKQNPYTGLFKGKNLIFITAEAFSAEVIDPQLTPTLYRLANQGIQFKDYYQPASAGTTGGEYQNIFGMLPTSGGTSFKKTATQYNYYTIASQLDRLGYYGKAFHNNSYTYYDRNKTHNNIGYSDGFMGYGNGMEAYVQKKWPQSDYEMFSGTLDTYIDRQPFSVYYMTVSGHSNYGKSGNAMTKRHWDRVQHLPYSDQVKGYLAANLDLEDALAYLVKRLEEKGIADDTVIVLSTDHFPYGLDSDAALGNMPYLSELYGYNVTDYFQRDHNRLIIWSGCLEEMGPIIVNAPTFSLDILPTLSNLFGTEFDSRLMVGRDVFSEAPALVFNANYEWKTSYGYYTKKSGFVQTNSDVELPEGYVDDIKKIVRNKMNYCKGVLDNDYFRYLFK